MYKLKLMNEYEFMKIFGCLEVLLALHQGSILILPSVLIILSTVQIIVPLRVFVVINVGVN